MKTLFFWSSPNFEQENGLILRGEIFLLVFIILKFPGPLPFENPAYATASAVFLRVAALLTNQIFILNQIFEKSSEYGKDLFACFVELEKVCNRVPRDKLWKVLQEYGIDGQLLRAIKSFYCRPEVCVRVEIACNQSLSS